MSVPNLLEIDQLLVSFGGLRAINELSFNVGEGEVVGLIGPNGSGKTTLFNAITAVVQPTSGEIRLSGTPLKGKLPNEVANAGISRTFQNIRLFPRMTVLENVALAVHSAPKYSIWHAFLRTPTAKRSDLEVRERAKEFAETMELTPYLHTVAGTLPYGLQRKLEIARALATDPKLLLLDEPAAGMNDEECDQLVVLLKRIHERYRMSVVLIEHHMSVIDSLCSRVVVLNLGQKIAEGHPDEIRKIPQVIQAYLGERRSRHAASSGS